MFNVLGMAATAASGGWWPIARFALIYVLPWVIALSAIGSCNLVRKNASVRHDADQQAIGSIRLDRDKAVADAKACSDGVKKVREAEMERKRELAKAVDAATRQFRAAEKTAQVTLQSAPTVVAPPGATIVEVVAAACASADALNDDKLRARASAREPRP